MTPSHDESTADHRCRLYLQTAPVDLDLSQTPPDELLAMLDDVPRYSAAVFIGCRACPTR